MLGATPLQVALDEIKNANIGYYFQGLHDFLKPDYTNWLNQRLWNEMKDEYPSTGSGRQRKIHS